jgi:exonuclease SbcC
VICAAEQQVDDLAGTVGALRGEYDRLAGSIKALSSTTAPCCPTCSATLSDPAALLATLRTAQSRAVEAGTQAKADADAATERLRTLRATAEQQARAVSDAEHAATSAEQAESHAAAAATDAALAHDQAEIAGRAHHLARQAAQTATAQASEDDERVRQTARALRQAETAAEAAAAVPAARTAAETAGRDAEAAAETTQQATAAEQALRVPEPQQEQARTALAAAQHALQQAQQHAGQADGDFRVAEQQVTVAERHRDQADARLRLRAQTVAEYEQAVAVREALDEFRKDRIARLAPELSEVATDFVARMTDGKYTAVELDEEFTPVLTDATGRQRPAAWLSGGEESAVALALRVAIGELIAGQRGGVLFLDEVLTAQDAMRRPAMMAAIRDLPGRQVITINHASEATDMVDLVLDVVPDDTDGSTIVPGSAYDVIDEASLDIVDAA